MIARMILFLFSAVAAAFNGTVTIIHNDPTSRIICGACAVFCTFLAIVDWRNLWQK